MQLERLDGFKNAFLFKPDGYPLTSDSVQSLIDN